MIRLRTLLLLAPLALLQVACSGSSSTPPAENVDSNGQPVSAVPWNKPENWETNGQLGNMQ
jgi:outer membrane biogenesis lipoprotein LolB